MNKIAVGKEARDAIDINAPVETNLQNIAAAKGKEVNELTVIVLESAPARPTVAGHQERRRAHQADYRRGRGSPASRPRCPAAGWTF